MAVGQDLDFDMPRPRDQLLQEDRAVGESGQRLALAASEGGGHLAGRLDSAHAAPAAAGRGLQHQRIAQAIGDRGRLLGRGKGRAAQHHRYVQRLGQLARPGLVAEQAQGVGPRPDEGQPLARAALGEGRVLGQEAIARVHAVAARRLGRLDQALDVQIGAHRIGGEGRPLANRPGGGGQPRVQRQCVGRRIDGDRFQAQRRGGARDTDGDFAAVGDQDTFEHGRTPLGWRARGPCPRRSRSGLGQGAPRRRGSACPTGPGCPACGCSIAGSRHCSCRPGDG